MHVWLLIFHISEYTIILPNSILVPLDGFTKNCKYCISLFKLLNSMMPDAVKIWLISFWGLAIGQLAEIHLTCSDNLKFISFHSLDILLIGRFPYWIILPLLYFAIYLQWFTWKSIGKFLCWTVYGYNSFSYILSCCLQWEENFIDRKFLLIYICA